MLVPVGFGLDRFNCMLNLIDGEVVIIIILVLLKILINLYNMSMTIISEVHAYLNMHFADF